MSFTFNGSEVSLINGLDASEWNELDVFVPGPYFTTTWLTTVDGETLTLPLRIGFNYNMLVDWGDGSSDTITAYNQAEITHTFATAGTQTITISGTCEAWHFNSAGDRLKFRTVEAWGTVGFTGEGLVDAFSGCNNATDLGGRMPYYAVTSLEGTFGNCVNVTTFPDVRKLTLVDSLLTTWVNCTSATSFPEVNTLVLVDALLTTWANCTSATSFPDVDKLVLVTSLNNTWANCTSATSFPDVDKLVLVTNLTGCWSLCTSSLIFPDVTTLPLVSSMQNTWNANTQLTSLVTAGWDLSSMTDSFCFNNAFWSVPLDAATQDGILAACVAAGNTGIGLDLSGGTTTPSAVGLAHKDTLVNDRSWTVTVNT